MRTARANPPESRSPPRAKWIASCPQRVTVQYLDADREYDVSSQYAERANVASVNSPRIDLPIVLTATEAAGIAEIRLYAAWLRRKFSFRLPATYLSLEPSNT